MGVNKVILIGNLGRDPELKTVSGGQTSCSFSIAISERWNDKNGQKQERTEWVNIVAWGKLAEISNQFLKKGNPCYVEGKLQTRSWDDKDGNKKYKTEVVASSIQFLGGNKQQSEPAAPHEQSQAPTGFESDDMPF